MLGCQFLDLVAQTFICVTAMLKKKKSHHADTLNHSVISITTVLLHCSASKNGYFFSESHFKSVIFGSIILLFCNQVVHH